jgi:deoxyguanosine kinase
MSSQYVAYIALGSNLGNRIRYLRSALNALAGTDGIDVSATSAVYESEAHTMDPAEEQSPYLNAVVELRTHLAPEALLAVCHAVEREHGRERTLEPEWAPRTIDLDIVAYSDLSVNRADITVPHPRIADRRFVLRPLVDIAPDYVVPPPYNATAVELLERCPDETSLTLTPHKLLDGRAAPVEGRGSASERNPVALRDDLRYIVVEGVIGAGKTSLTRMLAGRFQGQLILETFEDNPFLAPFYEDPPRWAFQTQLSFLASRFRQQKSLLERDLFHQVIISDYAFDKDRIFAHMNLQGDELQLYETLFTIMQPATPVPDLVVYLRSTPERLMRNISERGRIYEANMDPEYIGGLAEAYDYYFFRYDKSPLLIINATEIDFVNNPADFEELVHQIASIRHGGTTYFTPSTG